MAQNGDNGVTERRKDLAYQILCLRREFQYVREEFEGRVKSIEDWRCKADPIVQMMVKTMWVVSGASVVLVTATSVVVWIWLQDHATLSRVSELSIATASVITQMQKTDERHEREMERLQAKPK